MALGIGALGVASLTQHVEGEKTATSSALWWLWLPLAVFLVLSLLYWWVPALYRTWFEGEQGLLELAQFALAVAAMGVALWTLRAPGLKGKRPLFAWVSLLALGCLYIAGEEVSWGQHLFFWQTPETWGALNDQNETNLHNISNLLDQVPRTLLELAVVFGGILLPLIMLRRPAIGRSKWGVILPSLTLLPTAVLVELSRAPERLGELFVGQSVFFVRPSEVQELYIIYFLLLYAVLLKRRLYESAAEQA